MPVKHAAMVVSLLTLLSLGGCAVPGPEPRCVAEVLFPDDEIALGITTYEHDMPQPPKVESVRVLADGRETPAAVSIESGTVTGEAGETVVFMRTVVGGPRRRRAVGAQWVASLPHRGSDQPGERSYRIQVASRRGVGPASRGGVRRRRRVLTGDRSAPEPARGRRSTCI